MAISPDGKNVYVACGEGLEIVQYAVGPDGTLSESSSVEDDTSPLDVLVSPDGKSVYAGFLGISQYDVGPGGQLSPKNPPAVGDSRIAGNLAVSPDGRSLYASITFGNGFAGNQIDQYDVAADGTLTPKSPAAVDTGDFPRGLALTPDGRSLYVADFGSDEVSQYSVGSDGTLSLKSPPTVPAGQERPAYPPRSISARREVGDLFPDSAIRASASRSSVIRTSTNSQGLDFLCVTDSSALRRVQLQLELLGVGGPVHMLAASAITSQRHGRSDQW
ncbi:MAG: lactonase family protein [Actinobacteria bacterium]|nr:MAG: lactonase family protein [Actinomycetota bacterium]